ncbi:MAG TPA: hypothetical protein VN541_19280 [Tepidisphaeraceae bacterium]|nr:hypothetical protein [Tepidisphaeraceae bacterium]
MDSTPPSNENAPKTQAPSTPTRETWLARIVDRVFRSGRRAAKMTFVWAGACLCVIVVLHLRQARSHGTQAFSGIATPTIIRDFPTAGISVDSPPGWRQVPPEHGRTVTRWLGPDSKPDDIREMIAIDVSRNRGSARDAATMLASLWGGHVVDDHKTLAGEPAFLVEAEPKRPGLQPLAAYVAVHGDNVYALEGGATPGHSLVEQMELVRASWKWIPLEPPSLHLEFRQEPESLLDGKVNVNFPAAMHTFSDKTGLAVDTALYNHQLEDEDFDAIISFSALNGGGALERVEDSEESGYQREFNISQSIAWQRIDDTGERVMSDPLPVTMDKSPCLAFSGMVHFARVGVAVFEFHIYSQDPKEQAIYKATAVKILRSVTPGPNAQPPKRRSKFWRWLLH